jgi:isopentenyldiphosphate isomerase
VLFLHKKIFKLKSDALFLCVISNMVHVMNKEYLPLVDARGRVYGQALRSECHGNPKMIHPVVHLHVFNSKQRLFLQKRSPNKDLFPGFWDTSVGGHIGINENAEQALQREAKEELGIDAGQARFLYSYLMCNTYESEYVYTYLIYWDKKFSINDYEISEARFFSRRQIEKKLGISFFTPNFEEEFKRLCDAGIFNE